MKHWRCTVCGYIHEGEEPPDICPVCGATKEYFELVEEEKPQGDQKQQTPQPEETPAETSTGSDREWKCLVCGFIHRGTAAPEKCPVCHASPDRFDGRPATAGQTGADKKEAPPTASPLSGEITMQSIGRTIKPKSQLIAMADLLTRLHGHPIAVHIPNGLLPVSLLFTLLAMVFQSEPLAVAARYNCIFVAISMPVVLITGFIDWFNRFNGHLTSIFKIKLACGAIVTVLTMVLALWWTTNPNIYLSEGADRYLFLLVNFVNFAAAAVAGFYGGKLVFKD